MSQKIVHANYPIEVDELFEKEFVNGSRFARFVQLTKKMAELSNYEQYRLGATIILNGQVIGRGFNAPKSDPMQKKYNRNRINIPDNSPHFIHAELAALKKALIFKPDLTGAEIYIYHMGSKNQQKMARPCAGCMAAIKKHGIKKIIYSTDDGFAVEYITDKPIIVKKSKNLI